MPSPRRFEGDLDGGRSGWDLDVGAFPAVGEHDPAGRDELDELAAQVSPLAWVQRMVPPTRASTSAVAAIQRTRCSASVSSS